MPGRCRDRRRWFDRLEVGDVVLWGPRRRPRVVRSISRYEGGELWMANFAIMRCSWTGRGTTTVDRQLMKTNAHPSQARRRELDGDLDRKLAEECDKPRPAEPIVTCCDVKGVP